MRITPRRFLWLAGTSIFLVILASPLAAPGLAIGNSLTPPQSSKSHCPNCPGTALGVGLSYDADSQRCVFGGGGCELHYQ
jgi:hypothetical protein